MDQSGWCKQRIKPGMKANLPNWDCITTMHKVFCPGSKFDMFNSLYTKIPSGVGEGSQTWD